MLGAKINRILRRHVGPDGPGFAVLVMKGDKRVWAKGYGYARLDDLNHGIKQEKITTQTIFDLASISKQFTATGILMLIDQTTQHGPNGGKYQRLRLNTRLSRFFPHLPLAHKITIRHLLDHSSGLPDYILLRSFLQSYEQELKAVGFWYATMEASVVTNEDVIARIDELHKSEFSPGKHFKYCNTNYVVLAQIIRKITRKSLREFLQEEIFGPLKMHNTFVYDETVKDFKKHALCYRKRRNGQYVSIESDTVLNYIHGDGNVHSTIEDMMKWLRACNRISEKAPGALFSMSTFFHVFEPSAKKRTKKRRLRFKRRSGYAAGFHIYRYQKGNVRDFALHHSGEWLGFNSYMIRADVQLPHQAHQPKTLKVFTDFSIVVLANNREFSRTEHTFTTFTIMKELADFFWKRWKLPKARSRKKILKQL